MQIKQSFLLLVHKISVINLTVCFRHRCSARISHRSSQHGNYESSLIITIAILFILNLQRVQNVLARVVTRLPRFSHSVPLLRSLHWLPVVLFLRSAQLPIKHFQDLTRFDIQTKDPDGKWTRKPLAYRASNNFYLRVTRPPEICVHLVFKYIHTASSYTTRRQFVPFIYCPL